MDTFADVISAEPYHKAVGQSVGKFHCWVSEMRESATGLAA
jgi:hypothetical protein